MYYLRRKIDDVEFSIKIRKKLILKNGLIIHMEMKKVINVVGENMDKRGIFQFHS